MFFIFSIYDFVLAEKTVTATLKKKTRHEISPYRLLRQPVGL